MGLPAIQLVMIAARQVSKPIAEAFISYGKNHPQFRNRVLIPVGRSLVHLTTRLRMKRLGLGSPTSVAPVSEAIALEQASDFIQQIVLFSYSVGVFAGYYYYTKWFSSEALKMDEFEKWKEDAQKEQDELLARIKRLEDALIAAKWKLPPLPEPVKKEDAPAPTAAAASTAAAPAANGAAAVAILSKEAASSPALSSPTPSTPPSSASSSLSSYLRFPRISSLPLDSASKIVLEGESYTFCRRNNSISLERGDPDLRFLRFKPKENPKYSPGFVGLSERAAGYIIG
ncbi:hypothetical protein PFISCL1PPCAC_2424 [Pristionchus fissidentatus]|uniref:OPA3-like protein n=1 Tax=Pristionchus fissidentatus TaxID=1538716 RepID=A0AAV5UYC1_9BILA|nr:hypothetical protein PFISCL1PPCAC_2424 [Pristionchus fissidentatus]